MSSAIDLALDLLLLPFALGWLLAVGAVLAAPLAPVVSFCLLRGRCAPPTRLPVRKFVCYEYVPRAS